MKAKKTQEEVHRKITIDITDYPDGKRKRDLRIENTNWMDVLVTLELIRDQIKEKVKGSDNIPMREDYIG